MCAHSFRGHRKIRIRQTRYELADEIGFCVKTLNRTIKKLQGEGYIY